MFICHLILRYKSANFKVVVCLESAGIRLRGIAWTQWSQWSQWSQWLQGEESPVINQVIWFPVVIVDLGRRV